MSKITSSIKQIWRKFSDKDYRDGFVEDTIDDHLAIQIQSMRLTRDWTQDELARRAGTKQAGVCRWENSQPPASLATLKKIASAFDVALVVKFVPFSEFLLGENEPIDRRVRSFDDDHLPIARPISFVADGDNLSFAHFTERTARGWTVYQTPTAPEGSTLQFPDGVTLQ